MANYYVDYTLGNDGNDGLSVGAPWKTIAKVNAKSFAAGDFCVFNKTATWADTIVIPTAGSAGLPITFGAYGSGAKPIFDGTGLSYCIYEGYGRGFITVDGLEFRDSNYGAIQHSYWPAGVEGSTPNWIIQNCTFTRCMAYLFGPNTIVQDNVFVGPCIPTTTDYRGAVHIRGLVATNCSVLRNTISGYLYRGVWMHNGMDTPTVSNNIIHDIDTAPNGCGIDFDGAGRLITGFVTCTGNTIYSCGNYGIELENCSDGSLVAKNLVHDCPAVGIGALNYPAGTYYSDQRERDVHGEYSYNIVYHCGIALRLMAVSTVNVWNNILYDCAGSGTYYGLKIATYSAAPPESYPTHINAQNNIIGGGADSVFVASTHAALFDVFDYNQVKSALFYEYSIDTHVSLATTQGGGLALHCFTADPAFVDATNHDFHLTVSSPCINTGVDVGLTTDFEGNPIH